MCDKDQRRKRYMADQSHKQKMEKKAKNRYRGYPQGIMWVDEKYVGGKWVPVKKPFAMRVHRSRHATRFSYYKRYSNKMIRRMKNLTLTKGGMYKKVFDYQWTVD